MPKNAHGRICTTVLLTEKFKTNLNFLWIRKSAIQAKYKTEVCALPEIMVERLVFPCYKKKKLKMLIPTLWDRISDNEKP